MSDAQTDRDWEHFGRTDPYWAVVTNESFRRENLDDRAREFFFRTGEEYVAHVFEVVRSGIRADFRPERALDFGCGVGRLVVPLARRCDQVVGVDVSESMLEEARRVVRERKLANVKFVRGDDTLSAVQGTFDLVNSYIVLQHVPTARGARILARLVDLIREGGVGVLHVTYAHRDSFPDRDAGAGAPRFPWRGVVPGAVGKACRHALTAARKLGRWPGGSRPGGASPGSAPEMQMNHYDLNRVLHLLQRAGVASLQLELTDHSDTWGAILYFRKRVGGSDQGAF